MAEDLDYIPEECMRVKTILENENMTFSTFAKEIGKSPATITNILKGRNKPSIDVLQSICDRFRVINPEWLLTGVGSMYRQKASGAEQLLLDIRPELPEDVASSSSSSSAQPASPKTTTRIQPQVVEKIVEKKIQKIVVFFDDGTFQELSN